MHILAWPTAERPREKLLQRGGSALSDAELLAIFLRVGVPGASAVDIARQMLQRFGSLNGIFAAPQSELCSIPGMGDAKFAQLQAVLELSRRTLREQMQHGDALTHPAAVRDYLRLLLRQRKVECFVVVMLDNAMRVTEVVELSQGTLKQAHVYPQEVARQALLHHASAVIVAHNHPSGRAEPSMADIALTSHLNQALKMLDIQLIDHWIVAGEQLVSLAELGEL